MLDLNMVLDDLKAHFESAEADARKFAEEYLPGLADLAGKAAANPVVVSVLNAVHLSPEFLSALAAVIDKTEADLAAAAAAPGPAPAA